MNKSKRFNILKKSFLASVILAPIALSSCSGAGLGGNPQEKTVKDKENNDIKVSLSGDSLALAVKFDQESYQNLKNAGSKPNNSLTVAGGNIKPGAATVFPVSVEVSETNTASSAGIRLLKDDFEKLVKSIKVNGKGLKAVSAFSSQASSSPEASKYYNAVVVDEDYNTTDNPLSTPDISKNYAFAASNITVNEESKTLDFTLTIGKGLSWSASFEHIKFTNIF
ncbi:hypothetical protein [Mycoplasma sp. E35C]|uniref:hypothetical protein n=1 Tax=Mycoplasma sp. E35C TaxID=2801918 RepID=UPI001CA460A8|nr:hypothetical protein [Mycoplasma sp. E35C]QZX49410.1 hypothetical protein JJE79_01530 [Mycoplasma sp. E35C]